MEIWCSHDAVQIWIPGSKLAKASDDSYSESWEEFYLWSYYGTHAKTIKWTNMIFAFCNIKKKSDEVLKDAFWNYLHAAINFRTDLGELELLHFELTDKFTEKSLVWPVQFSMHILCANRELIVSITWRVLCQRENYPHKHNDIGHHLRVSVKCHKKGGRVTLILKCTTWIKTKLFSAILVRSSNMSQFILNPIIDKTHFSPSSTFKSYRISIEFFILFWQFS